MRVRRSGLILLVLLAVTCFVIVAGKYHNSGLVWKEFHYRYSEPVLNPDVVANESNRAIPGGGNFIAGAATVDITPPPGFLPRGGYATWSTVGQGVRTHLYARAYYLQTDEERHLVIQTDLVSGSRILHAALGERLAPEMGTDISRISLMATHTHSAPGQIVGSQFYNKHISNQAGFAEDYFEFVLQRISEAALQAYRSRGPAKLASGKTDIWGLTRNRSLPAYLENRSILDKEYQPERDFHYINPAMYMVRIDSIQPDGRSVPLGGFASFSIHGTALPEGEPLFNADVWAYIHKDWQWYLEQRYDRENQIHVSAFEGTHGDIAPAARFNRLGYLEARRIGREIGKHAIKLFNSLEKDLTAQVSLRSAVREVSITEKPRIGQAEICTEAAAGNTLAAAPLEHTSPVIGYLPFIRQGSRRWDVAEDDCQGRKRILGGDWVQRWLEPKDSFPDSVLFQIVEINDLLILPLPFEVTVESGQRIANAVRSATENSEGKSGRELRRKQVMVASLAGGYTGYVTTPEEYGRQYYEGGHTLFGKNTQSYLASQLRQLALDMSGAARIAELPEQWVYRLATKRFTPESITEPVERAIESAPRFYHAVDDLEAYWVMHWRDVPADKINLHEPLICVETRIHNGDWHPLTVEGVAVDDQGYDIAVKLLTTEEGEAGAVYGVYWYNPVFSGPEQVFRFVIQARGSGSILYSPPFR
ncbi:MAG: neutral/alkaline non-lysosomal ceramidase N-terminal domain-containing protein [Pseudomonadales bacterium]|nr:neutral/alkaline non-lysosomal ceramidase N-terminal domain-containing protein [Pseudomonadales bacterium]